MSKRMTRGRLATVLAIAMAAVCAAMLMSTRTSVPAAEEPPPENQEYTGVKRCASCHFEQYMSWRQTKHAKAFDDLTAKYQKDVKCLKCHTTGYGEPTGYKDQATTAALAGVTCERCHGPGSEHEKIAQQYAKVKTLTPEQEAQVKGSIWLMLPQNVCIECHMVQAHKPSETPPEMRSKD